MVEVGLTGPVPQTGFGLVRSPDDSVSARLLTATMYQQVLQKSPSGAGG